MPQTFRTPYNGYVALMKKSGTASTLTSGLQINIPAVHAIPLNPDNNTFPPVVATTSYPSQRIKGRKTPSVSITACFKPSWATANLFNSMVQIGADLKTDLFSIGLFDGTAGSLRIWDDCRCDRLQFRQNAMGGPVEVSMDFKCRFGDSEAPYGGTDPTSGAPYGTAPSFATPGSVDAGECYGEADTTITGMGSVRAYTFTALRGQAYIGYFNGTRFAADIGTTMFSGAASFDQDPGGTTIADKGVATIAIGASGAGVLLTASLVRDDRTYAFDVSVGNQQVRYSLVDLTAGGNPLSIVAL